MATKTDKLSCPLCFGKEHAHFITGFDRLYPRLQDFDYVRCLRCGLVFQSPLPNQEQIASFYIDDYKPYRKADIERMHERAKLPVNRFLVKNYYGADAERKPAFTRALAKFCALFAMKDTLVPFKKCRLLDVGCGNGGWIYKHKMLGWDVEGVEISDEASADVRNLGVTIHSGTLFDVPADKVYDVISLRHVIEHVTNPVETLLRAKSLLAPGGMIIMLMPNLDSYGFKRYGDCWYPLDPPRHLLQFTPRTIRLLGQKAGLDLVRVRSQIQARMVCVSRNYRKSFGTRFMENKDLETRKKIIEANYESETKKRGRAKLLRKFIYIPSVIRAWMGRGETMKVIYTAKGK